MSKSSQAPSSGSRNLRAYILSVIVGFIFTGIVLVLLSFITWFFKLSTEFNEFFSSLSFGTGCLFAGVFIGWVKRQNGLFRGIKAALLYLIPVFLITVITDGFSGTFLVERFITTIICGAVGGIIGVNRKKI